MCLSEVQDLLEACPLLVELQRSYWQRKCADVVAFVTTQSFQECLIWDPNVRSIAGRLRRIARPGAHLPARTDLCRRISNVARASLTTGTVPSMVRSRLVSITMCVLWSVTPLAATSVAKKTQCFISCMRFDNYSLGMPAWSSETSSTPCQTTSLLCCSTRCSNAKQATQSLLYLLRSANRMRFTSHSSMERFLIK